MVDTRSGRLGGGGGILRSQGQPRNSGLNLEVGASGHYIVLRQQRSIEHPPSSPTKRTDLQRVSAETRSSAAMMAVRSVGSSMPGTAWPRELSGFRLLWAMTFRISSSPSAHR